MKIYQMDRNLWQRIRYYQKCLDAYYNNLDYHERINEPYYHHYMKLMDSAIMEVKRREEESVYLSDDRRNLLVDNCN